MNRVLFEKSEVGDDGSVCVGGPRAAHIARVLKPEIGATLRVGILDGPSGWGTVRGCDLQDCSGNGEASARVALQCTFEDEPPEPPRVDVLLALPRPKVMRRLWATLASLGVGKIVLTNAEKVERVYFDTHWLDEDVYRPLLIEGLAQSGDTRVPKVTICRQLKPFVEDRLDAVFPDSLRLICHPRTAKPIGAVAVSESERVLLAIGPEGGWSDYEVDLFAAHGFDCVSMGWRTLRSDVACLALITAINVVRER